MVEKIRMEWNGMVWRIEKSEKIGWNGMSRIVWGNHSGHFDHSKWFENGLKNSLENGLTLQILRWYKLLRFKDIV